MRNSFYLLASVFLLGGCAYLTEKSNQNLTVLTPGAEDALCYVYVDGVKYKFSPPETVNIFKSKEPLVVDCLAPGNRRKKLEVKPTIARSAPGNVVTGVAPGLAWDYVSGALFKYPDIIEVDFTEVPVRPEALPAQNNPDVVQPEDYYLEEFSPSEPRMNNDRNVPPPELLRRGEVSSFNDNKELMGVIDSLSEEMNPKFEGSASEPLPLYEEDWMK